MEQKTLGDPEYLLMVEEEKRLCEKDTELIKGILEKGIGEKDGKIVDKDIFTPSIKINRKLANKVLYKSTDSESLWKLMTDIKQSKKMMAILEVKFPKTNAPELHFCFDMDVNIYKTGEEKIFRIGNREYRATPYRFEKNTDIILQWMELLFKTEEISVVDGEDPSISIGNVPIDIPRTILEIFSEFVKSEGKLGGKEHAIIVRDKEIRSDFI